VKTSQQGFTSLELLMILVSMVLVGFIGLHSYQSNHKGNLIGAKLTPIQLSLWYPKSWHITSNDVGINSGYFELKSPDAFVLGFQEANASFFSGGNSAATKSTASEVVTLGNIGSAVISADQGSGKFDSITVITTRPKIGEVFYPDTLQYLPHSPSIRNMYVQINGGFSSKSFSTLKAFDNEESVQQAKQILQSLKFY